MELIIVVMSVLFSCTHTRPNENAHLKASQSDSSEREQIRHEEGFQDSKNLWHPSYPSMSSTAMMLSWVKRPSDIQLDSNYKDIKKLFESAQNKDSVEVIMPTLIDNVKDDMPLNHYTFYFAVLQLDIAISRGKFSDNYKTFVENYRVFHIYARALRNSLNNNRYVNFIEKRFIKISKDHFGRTLQSVNSSSIN